MTSPLRRTAATLLLASTYISSLSHADAFVPTQSGSPLASAGFNSNILAPSTTSTTTTTTTTCSSALYASTSSSSSTTKTKKKKTSKKKQKQSTVVTSSIRAVGPGRSLTRDELANHVSSRYAEGMPSRTLDSTSTSEETQEYLKQLNSRPSLVLNADYQPLSYLPLSLWSWQDAVKAIFSGKVSVVDVYPDITVRAANIEVPLPSVIALTDYVQHLNQKPAFTRRNVFLRDEYKCQYCNHRFHTADLSLDHVVPRSQGGILSWDNAVTSCLKCNGRKGSTPVSQLPSIGMKLLKEPKCPTQMELAARAARMVPKRVHPTWKPSALYASTSSSSSTTKTKKKKTSKKKQKQSTVVTSSIRAVGPGRSLTRDELANHVSSRYAEGMPSRTLDSTSTSEETQEYLKLLNSRPSLVLNADYQPLSYLPLSLWSWQDAVKAIFSGKVSVVDVYPDITVRAANIEVPLPSVIALTDYVQHINQKPAFTRRNVFLRDEYKCQYCNHRFHTADLSLDHVVPRSQGGILSWDNAVTSCLKCNGRKGSTPVSQLPSIGMKLLKEPKCPTQMELAARAARMVPKRVHPTWKPYLGIAQRPSTKGSKGDEEYIDDRYFEETAD